MATATIDRKAAAAEYVKAGKAVHAYAKAVVSGRIVAGPHVRAACRRHLDDLRNGDARGLVFSDEKAGKVFKFFEKVLVLPDGDASSEDEEEDSSAGRAFRLQPWQKFIIGSLFGWCRKGPKLYRRFKQAYIETGKGSGKTPLVAGTGLYMLTADRELSAECYFGAVSRDQANIAFRDAVRMAETAPVLSRSLVIQVNNIAYEKTGSFMRAISSEGRSLDGKRVHFVGIDELHEHPTGVVVEKMLLNVKGRNQPLVMMITNSGNNLQSVCYDNHAYALSVVNQAHLDDEFFAYVCALDEGDEPFKDESCWVKANPNIGVSIQPEYIRAQVKKAQGMPNSSFANTVRRLNFCQWTTGAEQWVTHEAWMACAEDGVTIDGDDLPEELQGSTCYAALDKGESRDLTALVLAFACLDGRVRVRSFFWLPGDDLDKREEEDKVPYSIWVERGLLRALQGAVIDDDLLLAQVATIVRRYRPTLFAFDRWRMTKLISMLEGLQDLECYRKEEGETVREAIDHAADAMVMVDFGQGFRSMGPAVEETEKAIFSKRLRHDSNPLLNMCVLNARAIEDEPGNRKLVKPKGKQTARIDGAIAMVMAMSMVDQHRVGELAGDSIYERHGLLVV
jgi:phage terminase large subunit-like protein